ncbi:MAG: hypothetical protein Kow0098_22230 [Ignavibacteriaceae bacterium]
MTDFLNDYVNYLDESREHLSYQTIAAFIGLPDYFSEKEKNFVERHISVCPACREKYDSVFDEDLLIDSETTDKILTPLSDEQKDNNFIFASDDYRIKIVIEKVAANEFQIIISSLPDKLKGTNILVSMADNEKLRIVSAGINKNYKYHTAADSFNLPESVVISYILPKSEDAKLKERTGIAGKFTVYFRYAAAAVLLAAVLTAIYFLIRNDKNLETISEKIKTEQPDTTGDSELPEAKRDEILPTPKTDITTEVLPETDEELISDGSYAVNTALENFVNKDLRSQLNVMIISPPIGDTISLPATFQWTASGSDKIFNLVILNNKNQVQYQKLIGGNKVTIDKRLEAGLYYWKLEYNNNIVVMGKFFTK